MFIENIFLSTYLLEVCKYKQEQIAYGIGLGSIKWSVILIFNVLLKSVYRISKMLLKYFVVFLSVINGPIFYQRISLKIIIESERGLNIKYKNT